MVLARHVRSIAETFKVEEQKLWRWLYLTFTVIRDVSLEKVPQVVRYHGSTPHPPKKIDRDPHA